jgi:hypothetical protein
MKITVSQLRQIIREEIKTVKALNEAVGSQPSLNVSQIEAVNKLALQFGFKKVKNPRGSGSYVTLEKWNRKDGGEVELFYDGEFGIYFAAGSDDVMGGSGQDAVSDWTKASTWNKYFKQDK